MRVIANILPFRYVSDLSFRIYSNNISISEGLYGIMIQIIWFVIIVVIGNVLLNKTMKRVIVQGG